MVEVGQPLVYVQVCHSSLLGPIFAGAENESKTKAKGKENSGRKVANAQEERRMPRTYRRPRNPKQKVKNGALPSLEYKHRNMTDHVRISLPILSFRAETRWQNNPS